jgi:hypothetical protein
VSAGSPGSSTADTLSELISETVEAPELGRLRCQRDDAAANGPAADKSSGCSRPPDSGGPGEATEGRLNRVVSVTLDTRRLWLLSVGQGASSRAETVDIPEERAPAAVGIRRLPPCLDRSAPPSTEAKDCPRLSMDGEEMLEDERKIPGWGTPEEDDSAGGGGGELEFTWICSRLWWNLQQNVP